MSDNNTYVLPLYQPLSSGSDPITVNDYANRANPALDALVRSGDYFITVATTLETISAEMSDVPTETTAQSLARLADELLYVQKRYHVSPKAKQDPLTEL